MRPPAGSNQGSTVATPDQSAADKGLSAALGFRTHSGWAVAVTVAGVPTAPAVVDRRRIELVDRGCPGTTQPYHTAARLDLEQAEEFIQQCVQRTRLLAIQALHPIIDHLTAAGLEVVASGILLSSGRPTTDLRTTLASHALIHTAEGHFFREALTYASEHYRVPVVGVKERDLHGRIAAEPGGSADDVRRRVTEWGQQLGPPWRQDEKNAALVAWLALKGSGR